MNTAPHPALALTLALLMLVAGIGIPVMATLNAGLGQRLASPVAASAVLFAVAFTLAMAVLVSAGRPPALASFTGVPWIYYAGGFFTVFYILAITYAGPKIGIGNAVFFVLLGQMIAATIVDRNDPRNARMTRIAKSTGRVRSLGSSRTTDSAMPPNVAPASTQK